MDAKLLQIVPPFSVMQIEWAYAKWRRVWDAQYNNSANLEDRQRARAVIAELGEARSRLLAEARKIHAAPPTLPSHRSRGPSVPPPLRPSAAQAYSLPTLALSVYPKDSWFVATRSILAVERQQLRVRTQRAAAFMAGVSTAVAAVYGLMVF